MSTQYAVYKDVRLHGVRFVALFSTHEDALNCAANAAGAYKYDPAKDVAAKKIMVVFRDIEHPDSVSWYVRPTQ
jgi:hypothetical protein